MKYLRQSIISKVNNYVFVFTDLLGIPDGQSGPVTGCFVPREQSNKKKAKGGRWSQRQDERDS